MANANIKISGLPTANSANVYTNAGTTLLPIVTAIGSSLTTQKITVQELGNVILQSAGSANGMVIANRANVANTVIAGAQPNITSVGTLNGLNVTGTMAVIGNTTMVGNLAVTGTISGIGTGLTNIPGSAITGQVGFAGIANSVAGANVSGVVSAAQTASIVTGNNQPTIDTVGTLRQLNVIGNTNLGPISTVVITGGTLGQSIISNGAGGLSWGNPTATVANPLILTTTGGAAPGSTYNGSVPLTIDYSTVGAPSVTGTGASGTWAISITGAAVSATVASSANSIIGANVNGNVGSSLYSYSVDGGNVNGTVASAVYATSAGVAASANSVAGANVTGTVNNAANASNLAGSFTAGSATANGGYVTVTINGVTYNLLTA